MYVLLQHTMLPSPLLPLPEPTGDFRAGRTRYGKAARVRPIERGRRGIRGLE